MFTKVMSVEVYCFISASHVHNLKQAVLTFAMIPTSTKYTFMYFFEAIK